MRTFRAPNAALLPRTLHTLVEALSLRGPLADDPHARVLHGVLVGLLVWSYAIYLPFVLPFFVVARAATFSAAVGLTLACCASMILLRRGSLRLASWVFLAALYVMDTVAIVLFGGIRTPAIVHYVSLPIMAAWLGGARTAAVTATACLTSALGMALLEMSGHQLPHYFPGTPIGVWGSLATAMVAAALPVVIVLRIYAEALEGQRASLELLNNIIRTSQDCIVVKDGDLRTILANPSAAEQSGSEAAGRTTEEVRALAGETVRVTETVRITSPGGSQQGESRTFDTVKLPLRDGKGAVSGVLSVSHDVTARLQLEHQLRQTQRLESLGMLAGGVAHDFNNLLTVINGYGDMLLGGLKAGDPVRAPVAEMRKAGQNAADLVRQLLVFSRAEIVRPRRIDLNAQISNQLDMLRHVLGADIEILTELRAKGAVLVDRGQVQQVLMNLTMNARDAMPSGGTLTIRTADVEVGDEQAGAVLGLTAGAFVRLTVSDTGTGIPAEIQERVFDPFFTTKRVGEGTGLGLSTTYGIVRQSRGAIAVHSETGHGATFEIYLPRAGNFSEASAASQTASENTGSSQASQTILVIEDQAEVRSLLMALLPTFGYHVLEAATAEEALATAESHRGPIHLLLTDVVMPRMSGKEAAERFLRSRPGAKVLFMSAYAAEAITRRGALTPNDCFIAKPFTPAMLAARIREMLS